MLLQCQKFNSQNFWENIIILRCFHFPQNYDFCYFFFSSSNKLTRQTVGKGQQANVLITKIHYLISFLSIFLISPNTQCKGQVNLCIYNYIQKHCMNVRLVKRLWTPLPDIFFSYNFFDCHFITFYM